MAHNPWARGVNTLQNLLLLLPAVGDNAVVQTEPFKADPPKRKRCWFQFSLRSLLVFTAILCCLLAGPAKRAREQRAALDIVNRVGGSVLFDWENPEMDFRPFTSSTGQMYYQQSGREYVERSNSTAAAAPPGPAWLRHLIGDEYFQKVVIVDTSGHVVNDPPSANPVTNATLQGVCCLTSLRWLNIDHAKAVNDVGIGNLEALTRLERLFADDVPITDRGMKHLECLTHLEYLSINSPLVTDDGVTSLRGLKRLKYLYLGHTKITDRGLDLIKELKSLYDLYVPGTGVSNEAARRFEKSMPNCNVLFCEPGMVG